MSTCLHPHVHISTSHCLDMRDYYELLEESLLNSTGYPLANSYSNINLESQNILNFPTPQSLNLHLFGQPTSHSFSAFKLGNTPQMYAQTAYIYSSLSQNLGKSSETPLKWLVHGYRSMLYTTPRHSSGTLFYGQIHAPTQQSQGQIMKSFGQTGLLNAKWVIDTRFPSPFILTLNLTKQTKKATTELIYSTYENLVGLRSLGVVKQWNDILSTTQLLAGMELFFAANKKSPGVSTSLKYLKSSENAPFALTLVNNPLMGSVYLSYTVCPTDLTSLSVQFDYNIYSYLSDLTIGCEIYRSQPVSVNKPQVLTENKSTDADANTSIRDGPLSVFKASTSLASQSAQILYETSFHQFLVSFGLKILYGQPNTPINFGIDLTYS